MKHLKTYETHTTRKTHLFVFLCKTKSDVADVVNKYEQLSGNSIEPLRYKNLFKKLHKLEQVYLIIRRSQGISSLPIRWFFRYSDMIHEDDGILYVDYGTTINSAVVKNEKEQKNTINIFLEPSEVDDIDGYLEGNKFNLI